VRDGGLLWPMTRREAGDRLGAMVGAIYSGPLPPYLGGRHQVRSMHALDVLESGEKCTTAPTGRSLSLARHAGCGGGHIPFSPPPHHVAAQLRIRMT